MALMLGLKVLQESSRLDVKPIQAGEGGLICTNDSSLAEDKSMQNYGNQFESIILLML